MGKRYPGLDIIRFAAALLVTFYHLAFLSWVNAPGAAGATLHDDLLPIAPLVSSGWVGVPIFFTLSGFVIAFSAIDRTVGHFAISRAKRLYPAAWLCAIPTAMAIIPDSALGQKLIRTLTLYPFGPWLSAVYWTLAIEIIFYAVVATCIAIRRPRALDELGVGMAVTGILYWLLRLVDFVSGGHFKAIFAALETPLGGLSLITNAPFFGFGLLVWSIAREGFAPTKATLLISCLLAGVISNAASARFRIDLDHEPLSRILIAPSIYLVGSAAIMVAVFANGWAERKLGRFATKARTAGLLTYPLYLVHNEVGGRVMLAAASMGGFTALALGLFCVLVIAAAVLRLERYPQRIINILASRSGRASGSIKA